MHGDDKIGKLHALFVKVPFDLSSNWTAANLHSDVFIGSQDTSMF
jgi:hypothetical protein